MSAVVEVVADGTELARAAAREFVARCRGAVADRGSFSVALSGGSTPAAVYALLADPSREFSGQVPWDRVHVFWGDERHVPPDHLDSNYRAAREALLSRVPIPRRQIHPIHSELPDARDAAEDYSRELRTFFRFAAGQAPRFDLIFLGLGADGHTASLFPGGSAVRERRRLVVAEKPLNKDGWRITLTLPVINAAARVVFLVSGQNKAEALRKVLTGTLRPDILPAQGVRPESEDALRWLVDQEAASRLMRA